MRTYDSLARVPCEPNSRANRCYGKRKVAAIAIYHASTTPISRSSGRSSIAAAAYRSGSELVDERTGVVHDYTRKGGVVETEILTPNGGTAERNELWNAAEVAEKRKDARTGRDWTVALPAELNGEQRAELARNFGRELVNRYGVAVDLAIHLPDREGDNRNHHAHLMTTTREVSLDENGKLVLGNKASIELSDKARLARGLGRAADEITAVRQKWEQLANDALERAGRSERIDARSLRAQGVEREATAHLGPIASEMERRGVASDRGNGNRRARENNAERGKLSAQIIDLEAERERRDKARIERMSAAEVRGEIERVRPRPITQTDLFAASPDYMRAHAKTTALQLAVRAHEQQRDKGRNEASECARQVAQWQGENPIRAKLHSLGVWRNKEIKAVEVRAELAKQQSIEAEQRRIPLALRSEQLAVVEQFARERAQLLVDDQRKPTLKRVAELENIAQQKEREQGNERKLDEFMKALNTHALKREGKAYGYGDKGEHWTALPEKVRGLVNAINDVPRHLRAAAQDRIRENLQPDPELVLEMTRQLERSRDRGFSR